MNYLRLGGKFFISCFSPQGDLKWQAEAKNLVVNTGLEHVLDVEFLSGTQITSWFIGLTAATPIVAAADTMASHEGWAEEDAYSEATRQGFVPTRSGRVISNSASAATYTVNADATTFGGLFVTSASDKLGTTGMLFSAAAFTGGNKVADSGDTLSVTYDLTASVSQ